MTVTVHGTTGVSLVAPAAVPQAGLQAGVASNGPAFSAYLSANQTITPSTFTKVAINTEEFDTNNNFDTALSRFTPTVAGHYQVNCAINFSASASATRAMAAIHKNGTEFKRGSDIFTAGLVVTGAALIYMNGSTDYLEMVAYVSGATAVLAAGNSVTYFQAFLARSA